MTMSDRKKSRLSASRRTSPSSTIWRGSERFIAVSFALILFTTFILIGAFGAIYFSLFDYYNYESLSQMKFVGLKHYINMFTLEDNLNQLRTYLSNTIYFSLGVTIFQNLLAILLAVLVNLPLRSRNFYRAAIFFPNIIGIITIGLVWRLMLSPNYGPINAALNQWFNLDSALLGDINLAMPLLIFVQIWLSVGYAMTIYLAGLQSIPSDVIEAAKVDGATPRQTFWFITLPLLQPAITINILLSLIGSMKVADLMITLTSGGPGTATRTLAYEIYRKVVDPRTNMGDAAAWSNIHFLVVLVVVLIALWYMSRRERNLE